MPTKITNRRLVKKEGPDYYPTPAWATKALLDYVKFDGVVKEPACGNGAMAEVFKENGYTVVSSDLFDRGYGKTGQNFLESTKPYANFVTNPPFNLANQFVQKCFQLCENKFALLLRLAFLESVTRYEEIFSAHPPSLVLVFSQRLSMYPEGKPVQGGGTTSYAWFIWDMQDHTGDTIINWIKPGYKPQTRIKNRGLNDVQTLPRRARKKRFQLYLAEKQRVLV